MQRRFLSSIGRSCGVLAFGTWPLGGASAFAGRQSGLGSVDASEARRALARAFDAGIDFFDTADTYGNGRAEQFLGEVLSHTTAIFCTKLGNRESGGRAVKDFSTAWIEAGVAASLRRLRRETIDILLLHSPPDDYDWQHFDSTVLQQLAERGLIRAWGVSCRGHRGAERVIAAGMGAVVEVIYNAFDRRIEETVLPSAASRCIDILARVPLASGFLADREPVFGADDIRSKIPDDDRAWRIEMASRIRSLLAPDATLAAGALRFAISNRAVATVIAGMRNVRQVEENTDAVNRGALGGALCARVREAVPEVFHGWS